MGGAVSHQSTRNLDLDTTFVRAQTFTSSDGMHGWPLELPTAEEVSKSGFRFKPKRGQADRTKCVDCGIIVHNWSSVHDPAQQHRNGCRYLHAGSSSRDPSPQRQQEDQQQATLTYQHPFAPQAWDAQCGNRLLSSMSPGELQTWTDELGLVQFRDMFRVANISGRDVQSLVVELMQHSAVAGFDHRRSSSPMSSPRGFTLQQRNRNMYPHQQQQQRAASPPPTVIRVNPRQQRMPGSRDTSPFSRQGTVPPSPQQQQQYYGGARRGSNGNDQSSINHLHFDDSRQMRASSAPPPSYPPPTVPGRPYGPSNQSRDASPSGRPRQMTDLETHQRSHQQYQRPDTSCPLSGLSSGSGNGGQSSPWLEVTQESTHSSSYYYNNGFHEQQPPARAPPPPPPPMSHQRQRGQENNTSNNNNSYNERTNVSSRNSSMTERVSAEMHRPTRPPPPPPGMSRSVSPSASSVNPSRSASRSVSPTTTAVSARNSAVGGPAGTMYSGSPTVVASENGRGSAPAGDVSTSSANTRGDRNNINNNSSNNNRSFGVLATRFTSVPSGSAGYHPGRASAENNSNHNESNNNSNITSATSAAAAAAAGAGAQVNLSGLSGTTSVNSSTTAVVPRTALPATAVTAAAAAAPGPVREFGRQSINSVTTIHNSRANSLDQEGVDLPYNNNNNVQQQHQLDDSRGSGSNAGSNDLSGRSTPQHSELVSPSAASRQEVTAFQERNVLRLNSNHSGSGLSLSRQNSSNFASDNRSDKIRVSLTSTVSSNSSASNPVQKKQQQQQQPYTECNKENVGNSTHISNTSIARQQQQQQQSSFAKKDNSMIPFNNVAASANDSASVKSNGSSSLASRDVGRVMVEALRSAQEDAVRHYAPHEDKLEDELRLMFDRLKVVEATFPPTHNVAGGTYVGELRSGQREGVGRAVYDNADEYVGAWHDDRQHGVGMHITAEGTYIGHFQGGQRQGYGRYEWMNGDSYVGEWIADVRSGEGQWISHAGNIYNGSWLNDRRNGYGMFKWANGDVYEGNWVDDRMQGEGSLAYSSGNIYMGEFLKDLPHGHGRFTWVGGDVYEGPWVHGEMRGEGRIRYANGNVYVGAVSPQGREGWGRLVCGDGTTYDGDWVADRRCGYGHSELANRAGTYTGQWEDDKMHGKGTLNFADGTQQIGIFEFGVFVSSLESSSISTISGHAQSPPVSTPDLKLFSNGSMIAFPVNGLDYSRPSLGNQSLNMVF